MSAFWIVATVFGGIVVIVFAVIMLMAGNTPDDDPWSGWYRGKTHDVTQTHGFKGAEWDSMDDHGNRDLDGGL